MVRVVPRGRFRITAEAELGERHQLPHCHVSWRDGESVVDLRDEALLGGDGGPAAARTLVRDHRRDIRRAWDRLNSEELTR